MSTVDILIAARKKIEREEDWGKGVRHDRRSMDSCCVAEAIEESAPMQSRKAAYEALRRAGGISNDWGALIEWNDAPERTHAEVLAAFDLAIALARNMPT